MASYTFISSRDPVDGDRSVHDLAATLASSGNDVTLFMVENGSLLARPDAGADLRQHLTTAGVTLLADQLALDQRGIVDESLAEDVEAAGIDVIIDHMAAGHKVTWH